MGRKVLPVMALTYEAFCACIEQNIEVIHIDMEIYKAYAEEIRQKLEENGYDTKGFPARRGVFFARDIDVSCCEILDPCRLF